MIFIGPELSNPHAHFRTNIVDVVGGGNDLVIDLYKVGGREEIYHLAAEHLQHHDERYVVYNAYEDEDFLLGFRREFPRLALITIFSDDEWRHANYDRYLALYSDVCTVTVKDNIRRYRAYGLPHVHYMQWACNPDAFHPLAEAVKTYDVSFIGAAYGKRVEYVRHLLRHGVNVRVFGPSWDRYRDIRAHWGGFLPHSDMLEAISQSKINLNFLWTSWDPGRTTIKGRTLELAACRAFQLSNDTEAFANCSFVDGVNIAVFQNKGEMLEKIEYYLAHEDEREAIAARSYEHALKHHTWKQRFRELFGRLEQEPVPGTAGRRKYRILVLAGEGVRHQIAMDDERMDIRIFDPEDNWREDLGAVDGVVQLTRDSSINNETLYMMAFGLMADKSDVIAANFYVDSGTGRCWIRFRDKVIERKRTLLRILPQECMMLSRSYVEEHGAALAGKVGSLRVSYIEYPSFSVDLPYYHVRKLRLYFGHHRDARNRFREYMQAFHIGKAFSIGVDKVWQRMLRKRTGA